MDIKYLIPSNECFRLSENCCVSELNNDSWPPDANTLRTADLESHKTLSGVAGLDIRIICTDVY